MSAVQRVFDTYELLENILSRLSARDVRVAKRVDRTWRQLVERSSRLHMYAKADKEMVRIKQLTTSTTAHGYGCSRTPGPLYGEDTRIPFHPALACRYEPFLLRRYKAQRRPAFLAWYRELCFDTLDYVYHLARRSDFLTSRPVEAVHLGIDSDWQEPSVSCKLIELTLRRIGGVRIEDLKDILSQIPCEDSCFVVCTVMERLGLDRWRSIYLADPWNKNMYARSATSRHSL